MDTLRESKNIVPAPASAGVSSPSLASVPEHAPEAAEPPSAAAPVPCDDEDAPPADWAPERPHPNAMREKFCLAFVATPNATRAAVVAGYSPRSARQLGSRLLQDPHVLMRIEELRLANGVIYDIPRDTLLDRLEMLFWQALETNNLGVALGAVAFQSKLAGHTMPGRFPPRPSAETLHLIGKMSSLYTARRMGHALAPDEEQFATGYSPRWRATGRRVFEHPMEDIHRHYSEEADAHGPRKQRR